MKIMDILKAIDGKLIIGNENAVINSFSKDTRTIHEGDLYFAIKGDKFDGNKYYLEAFSKGASTVIMDDEKSISKKEKNIILVDDTIKALQKLAIYKRSLCNVPVIAITGSVGKTSTKDIIYSVLSQKYKTFKSLENHNNGIGLPMTLLDYKDEEVIVLEMGMNSLGEISLLSKIAKPDIAIITNVGTAHLGNLGSRENILKAKLEIMDGMNEEGILIINNDNDLLHSQKSFKVKNIITVGIYNKSDFIAESILYTRFCSKFKVNNYEYSIKIPGEPFIYNSLLSIATGFSLKLTEKEIASGLKNFELSKNRLEVWNLDNNISIINDTYNANLDSMKFALDFLVKQQGDRKIAVLGDILELGEFSKKIHYEIGSYLGTINIDKLICFGDQSRYIAFSAVDNGLKEDNIELFENKEDLIAYLKDYIKEKDTLLFKASNGMKLIDIAKELKEFCTK